MNIGSIPATPFETIAQPNYQKLEEIALDAALVQTGDSKEDRDAYLKMLLMHIIFGSQEASPTDMNNVTQELYNPSGATVQSSAPVGAAINTTV